MNIRPTGNRVLLRRAPKKTMSTGGLHLPETAEDAGCVEAVVLNVGRDVTDVTEGDTVLVARYGGQEVKIDSDTLVLLPVDEVLGVVER